MTSGRRERVRTSTARAVAAAALALALQAAAARAQSAAPPDLGPEMSSMSIVGFDPATGEVGIALASRFFAVAPVAAHVRAGVGAVAMMGGAPFPEGQLLLAWLQEGASPEEALARLRTRHPQGIGQINIVDARGRSVSTTSQTQASMWKGHRFGPHYAAAGNILAGPQVVDAFATSFEASQGSGLPLAERLLAALEAADAVGGDARGRMGATLIVKKPGAGYMGVDDLVNLRVDDSRHAIHDLRKLYSRWEAIRGQVPGSRIVEQTRGADVRWLQSSLRDLGYLSADDRSVFGADGVPVGLFNNATAAAVAKYKSEHGMGASPSAGLETVNSIRRELQRRRSDRQGGGP